MRTRQRSPVPVREALRGLARALGLEERLAAPEVSRAWPRVVGPSLAARAHPARLEGGRLLVHAADSATLHRLSLMRRDIARNLNDALGRPAVRDVRLRIGPCPGTGASRPAAPDLRGLRRVPPVDPDTPAIREALGRVKGLPFEEVLHRILQRQSVLRPPR